MKKEFYNALTSGDNTPVKLYVEGIQKFNNVNIPIVTGGFGNNNKVMSDKSIAEIHNMQNKHVREAITKNIKRFKENIDFIDLKKRADLLDPLKLGYSKQAITQAEHIYLLSERGYSKLIKIMDTDLAWEIHDQLIDDYFMLRYKPQAPMSMEDIIIYQMEQSKLMKQQIEETKTYALEAKEEVQAVNKKVESIKDVVAIDTHSWREDTKTLINKIATHRGGTHNIYQETRQEAYELLNKRFGVNLEQRLMNKRRRMAEEGISKSKRDKLTKVDIIAEDKKLIEGYLIVVKDMAIKYGAI